MRKFFSIGFKVLLTMFLFGVIYVLIRSSLDIYNNFAYDKAIIRETPYGMTPLLTDPKDYHSANGMINNGDYVYVVDWLSAYNGKVVFAKVKSRLKEGYINKELLVQTNINVKPIISVLLLSFIFCFTSIKLYKKLSV